VLADDAAIRDLTQPWMARLQHLMTSTSQERRLNTAYGTTRTD
jgi:flagellar protein FliT